MPFCALLLRHEKNPALTYITFNWINSHQSSKLIEFVEWNVKLTCFNIIYHHLNNIEQMLSYLLLQKVLE